MRKKTIIILMVALVLGGTTSSFGSGACGDCEIMNTVSDEVRKGYEDVSNDVYDTYVIDKDDGFWDECVGGIIDGGASFDLSIPSLSSLIDKACNYVKSEAKAGLSEASSSIVYDAGFGFSAGAKSTSTGAIKTNVEDSSTQLTNDIWNSIK